VVNGQKVWTSYARHARWAILLARTNPDVPKHRGLTFFILDMHLPGVTVVPIRQADGTDHHFNEVFLDDVRAPDSLRLGDVGMGWAISVEGLSAEREGQGHTKAPFEELREAWRRRRPASAAQERVWRDRMAQLWIRTEIGHHTVVRLREQRKRGGAGNDGAITKIAATELTQDIHMMALELLGPEGQVGGEYQRMLEGTAEETIQLRAVRSRAASIEGGTNQILRNIIGERILGLPGDVRVDKDIAWKDVRRS
jgi:alkylation response protein AidB-like acyl-CoA dehydrogenase